MEKSSKDGIQGNCKFMKMQIFNKYMYVSIFAWVDWIAIAFLSESSCNTI